MHYWKSLSWLAICVCLGCLGLVGCSPPWADDVVDEQDGDALPVPSRTLLEKLAADWDSESVADWPVAEVMAQLSNVSYLPPVDAQPRFEEIGFESVETFVDGSMLGYVVTLEDAAVIVFRGTDDRDDWISNLDILSVDTPHGAIHRGFFDAYETLQPQLEQILAQQKPETVWITGHSLGGALAVVCAYDLAEKTDQEISGVITFGQPMVAQQRLADHLDDVLLGRYAHYVNGSDIIPRIPPTFTHCGSLVWFTGDGVKRSRPKRTLFRALGEEAASADTVEIQPMSPEEFEQLQTSLKSQSSAETLPEGTLTIQGSTPWFRDHGMDLYLEEIRSVTTRGSD